MKIVLETVEKLYFSTAVKHMGGGEVALLKKDARTFSAISFSIPVLLYQYGMINK